MIRQARAGDAVLYKSRKITGRTRPLPWWLGEEGVKTTEYIGPVALDHLVISLSQLVWALKRRRPQDRILTIYAHMHQRQPLPPTSPRNLSAQIQNLTHRDV
jgi:hypothetical protein